MGTSWLPCGANGFCASGSDAQEPTTYLDLVHQINLLELFRDRNHACRYADHLVVLRQGQLVAQGAPKEIVTAALVEQVFDLPCRIIEDPVSETPLVMPEGRVRGEVGCRSVVPLDIQKLASRADFISSG